jgi:hypothetical protein
VTSKRAEGKIEFNHGCTQINTDFRHECLTEGNEGNKDGKAKNQKAE